MKVKVLADGKTAVKENGRVCVINGLRLKSGAEDRPDPFYFPSDHFFKVACPPGTYHEYETLPDGKINLL